MGAWLVLCVGYVVRMYAAPYLVMNSFYMLAILIQYFAFQNPDIFLDRKTGALSHLTATPYLQELNERGPSPPLPSASTTTRRAARSTASGR